MKMTIIPVVAAIVAAGLFTSSSRSDAQESGPHITRQPSGDNSGGEKAGVVPNQCPDNYYISAFQAIKDNPNQRAINVWCKPLPKVSAMPSDPSEKAHNAKEAPSSGGGPKVECEDGYYTSAFALRVDAPGGLTGQRSVDFWCKPFPKVNTMPGNLGERGPVNTGYDCSSSDNLRPIRHFENGGSGSSGVRV